MSEEKNPETLDSPMEVLENEETVSVNYLEKSLAELADLFMELAKNPDRMQMNKDAEAIKSAFYRNLAREKAAAGIAVTEEEGGNPVEETAGEDDSVSENPFAEIERGFKALYNAYRKERAEYNRQQEKEREHNLELKEAVIKDLKALLDKQEDVNRTDNRDGNANPSQIEHAQPLKTSLDHHAMHDQVRRGTDQGAQSSQDCHIRQRNQKLGRG